MANGQGISRFLLIFFEFSAGGFPVTGSHFLFLSLCQAPFTPTDPAHASLHNVMRKSVTGVVIERLNFELP
jgi:hypothetical protein